jgi:chromosome segregation ATPase
MKVVYTMLVGMLLILPACNTNDNDRVRASGEMTNTEQMREQRDQYIRAVEAKLDEFDQKIDGLEQRASSMSDRDRQGFEQSVDRLRDHRKDVDTKLNDMKDVSIESWTTMKSEVDSALNALEQQYQQVSTAHDNVPAGAPKTPKSY